MDIRDYAFLRPSKTFYHLLPIESWDPKVVLSLKQVEPPSVQINVSFNCWSPQNVLLQAREIAQFVKNCLTTMKTWVWILRAPLKSWVCACNPSTGKWEAEIRGSLEAHRQVVSLEYVAKSQANKWLCLKQKEVEDAWATTPQVGHVHVHWYSLVHTHTQTQNTHATLIPVGYNDCICSSLWGFLYFFVFLFLGPSFS